MDPAHIGVTTKGGVVTLTGHVTSYAEKIAAEAAPRKVKGVIAVADEIEVRLPFGTKRCDTDIAGEIVGRLASDVSIPHNTVKVTVESGWVTLTGQVDWYYQISAVGQEIRWLSGVTGVSNEIVVKVRLDTSKISSAITDALHRSWLYDPKTVIVSADSGKIRLTGTVRSLHERELATATAWAAPGATAVENDLAIV